MRTGTSRPRTSPTAERCNSLHTVRAGVALRTLRFVRGGGGWLTLPAVRVLDARLCGPACADAACDKRTKWLSRSRRPSPRAPRASKSSSESRVWCRCSVRACVPLLAASDVTGNWGQVPGEHSRTHPHASAHPNVHPRAGGPHILACSGEPTYLWVPKLPAACGDSGVSFGNNLDPCVHFGVQWLVEHHPTKPSKAEWHEVRRCRFFCANHCPTRLLVCSMLVLSEGCSV